MIRWFQKLLFKLKYGNNLENDFYKRLERAESRVNSSLYLSNKYQNQIDNKISREEFLLAITALEKLIIFYNEKPATPHAYKNGELYEWVKVIK